MNAHRRAGDERRGQQRLQHQRDAAGGAHVETEFPAAQLARAKDQLRRSQLQPLDLGVTQSRDGFHRGEMLGSEARRGAPRTDVVQPDRLAGDGGKRTGRAQKLSAALAVGTVYFAHSAVIIHRVRFHDQREHGPAWNPR